MNSELTPSRPDEKWIQDYLAGRLSEAEAEEFEARCLADDTLGEELERALEIRAAMKRSDSKPRARSGRWGTLLPLAVAAGAAMLVAGFYWLQTPQQSTPLFRGAQQALTLEVDVSGNQISARWPAVPGAAGYELRLFERDGRLIRSMEVDGTASVIDLSNAGSIDPGRKPSSVDVTALDAFGQTLLRSQRIAVSSGAAE
jgi:hypothetical protein